MPSHSPSVGPAWSNNWKVVTVSVDKTEAPNLSRKERIVATAEYRCSREDSRALRLIEVSVMSWVARWHADKAISSIMTDVRAEGTKKSTGGPKTIGLATH